MAHSDIRLLTCPEGYKLALGEDESELVDFGDPLQWEAPNGKTYLAFVDLPEGAGDEAENVESLLPTWVYEAKALEHVEPEDDEDEEGAEGADKEDVVPGANGGEDEDEDDDDEEPIYDIQ